MPKIKKSKTKSQPNTDLAPLPERRRSTFRAPAADVDLGLFGLGVGDRETAVTPEVVGPSAIAEASDVAAEAEADERVEEVELSAVADEPEPVEVAEPVVVAELAQIAEPAEPEAAEPDAPEPEAPEPEVAEPDAPEPDAPVATPSQHRARHRADRTGNRRASGGSSFRVVLSAF
ncbi:hypothetical protein LQ757_14955 [Agromyces sp. SYSU K20354]|uniref:hypothetical protein n=1 Tax=Agromyces cavernae TaxID=2898659 RepID=UPI001E524896|nr:hypothetical protein [Agromyces cavernae]MCD2443576.1 hypothetical protein [Agromyces cavernae]